MNRTTDYRPRAQAWADDAERLAAMWAQLVDGTARFVNDGGFGGAIIGLSGGIDSAVVAAIAVDALGADRVRGVAMPGPYSSDISRTDAFALAEMLDIRCDVVPIVDAYNALAATMWGDGNPIDGPVAGTAAENLQARLRGTALMTLSNATGSVVLNTGNRSEGAVGYCTLHGDMVGALAPLGNVFKTDVFALARWRNASTTRPGPIPSRTLMRPPSAELADGQLDDDALPPYDVLDRILVVHANGAAPAELAALVDSGVDREVADRVQAMMDSAAFKARYAPPAVPVSWAVP